jgi:hypothetical protein
MSKEFYFCRFEGYSCVECCEAKRCGNLSELKDGTRGCPGYFIKPGDKAEGAFPILDSCKMYDCLDGMSSKGVAFDTPEMINKIRDEIKKRPVGEYKMHKDIIKPILAELTK